MENCDLEERQGPPDPTAQVPFQFSEQTLKKYHHLLKFRRSKPRERKERKRNEKKEDWFSLYKKTLLPLPLVGTRKKGAFTERNSVE
jgi:hypothetical protein